MESSKWDADAMSVKSPVANVQVMGAEFYRAWSAVSHLKDADVVFSCLYDSSPDQLDAWQALFVTKGFRLGSSLARNNFPFEVDNIFQVNFACRAPLEVSELNTLIHEHAAKCNIALKTHELVINGQKYNCVGKDLGGATMLFNILCLGVSAEQVAHLRSELLNNGALARILFDPEMVPKFTIATDRLSRIVVLYARLFSGYLPDELMRYAAALLVVEEEITPEFAERFTFDTSASVRRYAMDEIEVETVTVLKSKTNAPSLEGLYHDGVKHLDPWLALPDADIIAPFMDEPLLDSNFDVYLKGTPVQFAQSVNSSVLSMELIVESFLGKPNELLGASVLASGVDFCADVPVGVLTTLAANRYTKHKQPLEVFILGSNRRSAFQFLGLSKAVTLVLLRKDGELFDAVRHDKVRTIIYDNPAAYANKVLDATKSAVYVIDTADHAVVNTGRREYRHTTMRGPTFSMDRAFSIVSNLFGKVKAQSPANFHASLPGYVVMRFVPNFGVNTISHVSLFNNMVHHYDMNFYPPVDFHGTDFTVTMLKRAVPQPKIHERHHFPLHIFQAFVMHVMSVRVSVLYNILHNRYSWRVMLPIRLVSRMFSNNSARALVKLNTIFDFSTWGSDIPITEFNNLFGDYKQPGVFDQGYTYVAGTPVRQRKPKRNGTPGVSKLVSASNMFMDYLNTHAKPTDYGPVVSMKPKFVVDRANAVNSYPI